MNFFLCQYNFTINLLRSDISLDIVESSLTMFSVTGSLYRAVRAGMSRERNDSFVRCVACTGHSAKNITRGIIVKVHTRHVC